MVATVISSQGTQVLPLLNRPLLEPTMEQGWLLVLLTSITTTAGCCVIFVDYFYKLLFPRLYARHPFNISDNSTFLICSLSLSSGCLLFTSLFKLLPEGKEYMSKVSFLNDGEHERLRTTYFLGSYLLGIAICGLLNITVHYCTSESIVHCVHDEDDHAHGHAHEHTDANSDELTHRHSHSHSLSHSHQLSSSTQAEENSSSSGTNSIEGKTTTNTARSSSDAQSEGTLTGPKCFKNDNIVIDNNHNETTPLLATVVATSKEPVLPSVVDTSLNTTFHGKCAGFGSLETCCIIPDHHLHQGSHLRSPISTEHIDPLTTRVPTGIVGLSDTTHPALPNPSVHVHPNTVGSTLHYCDLPSCENILFFDNNSKTLINTKRQMSKIHSEIEVFSPLMKQSKLLNNGEEANCDDMDLHKGNHGHWHSHTPHHPHHHSRQEPSLHNDTESQIDGHEHHHHRITTPLSRLLSIGLQTVLAITLHKLPEGFIMYSTSKADPKLGLTIFISMFIHNFVEGFTMTLPIYIALNSRLKALLISGLLGSCAQPIGALMGYFLFRNKSLDMDSDSNNMIFGLLISMTSGFLTIIGLQMFASSISFGGKQGFVLVWACIGIGLISFSMILVDLD